MSLKIKISDEFLDGGTQVFQDYAVNNLGDISNRQSGFSNSFSVPVSEKNNRLLGYSNDLNTSGVKPYRRVDAELYDNNTRVSTGYVKIEMVSRSSYQCSFFSDNASWFTLIKDKKINQLDYSDLDHQYTPTNATGSFSNTTGYVYPIIDYGNLSTQTTTSIPLTELFPAIFVHEVVSRVFKDIDWKIQGDMINSPTFNRMILPFSKDELSRSEADIEDETVTATVASTNTGLGNGDFVTFDGTDTISMSLFANYDILIEMIVVSPFNDVGGTGFDLVLEKNGTTDIMSIQNITVVGTYSVLLQAEQLTASDTLKLRVDHASTGTISISIGSFVRLTPDGVVLEGSTINMGNTIADIATVDFLQYLFNYFGVYPVGDPVSKTLTCDFFRNIKTNISDAEDWSNLLDVGSSYETNFEELLQNYGQQTRFNYLQDDEDDELNAYNSVNNQWFGQGSLTLDNQHLEGIVDLYEAPFASSINLMSLSDELYVPQIIKRIPRIMLITAGETISISEMTAGLQTTLVITASIFSPSIVSSAPFAWFAKAPYTTNTDKYPDSLAFGDIIFTTVLEGSLSTYWSEYEEALNRMKYLKAFFRLDSVDIQNLDFGKPIFVAKFNSYFYLNKIIQFSGKDSLTECELIKIA